MVKSPILILKNITHEGPGSFLQHARNRGFAIDVVDLNAGEKPLDLDNYCGVVICGGPDSANDDSEKINLEIQLIKDAIEQSKPYFGICLGMQLLAAAAGAQVVKADIKEIGFMDQKNESFKIELNEHGLIDPLFSGLAKQFDVFQLHGETIIENDSVHILGTGKWCKNQIIKVGDCAYGIQAHVELTEELFEEVIVLDDDLRIYDHAQLRKEYASYKESYDRTSNVLFNNFLDMITEKSL
ncbi:MAG: type 1 glutamine amidotransferase [Acidimicrobiia bacterium]